MQNWVIGPFCLDSREKKKKQNATNHIIMQINWFINFKKDLDMLPHIVNDMTSFSNIKRSITQFSLHHVNNFAYYLVYIYCNVKTSLIVTIFLITIV